MNYLNKTTVNMGCNSKLRAGVVPWGIHALLSSMRKEAYLALAAAQYDELRAIGQEPDFYTLEEKFDPLWTALGRSVLEQALGPVPANQQKKTAFRPGSGA